MAMTGDQFYGRPSFPRMSGGGWGEFVRRRLAEIAGGVFIAIALAYLLSVLTAHESDPSFNRAIDGPTLNLMGPVGAFIGDFALQGLGLAAILFALAPAAWGWKLIRDRRLERWWLKITLLPFAALLTAGACAAIPSPAGCGRGPPAWAGSAAGCCWSAPTASRASRPSSIS